jgi:hypothetical protein
MVFGSAFAAIGFVGALMLRAPREGQVPIQPPLNGLVATRSYTPAEMLKTPVFG